MSPVNAQKRGSVWCFGDSALIDFKDTANIITGTSIVNPEEVAPQLVIQPGIYYSILVMI
ncbi:MAG: hypothetical protein IPG39_11025 [Bacteroidetes bacterium]|nr:hypothetical protein [Bacteroidota bacterium]